MVKRQGDKTPEPAGGRAAERLRMFEESRGVVPKKQAGNKKSRGVDQARFARGHTGGT